MEEQHFVLGEEVLGKADRRLGLTDALLAGSYPGETGERQPVHTVYIPADRWAPGLTAQWGRQAVRAAEEQGGLQTLLKETLPGLEEDRSDVAALASSVRDKLTGEPVEDLRIDFEDGFGIRDDADEDHWAVSAAQGLSQELADGTGPPFVGIRFKSMEAPVRRRGLRTLDLFLAALLDTAGQLPEGLRLTLPKVTTVDQVKVMVDVLRSLEEAHSLPEGRLRFEVQVETPQIILGPDGRSAVAEAIHAAEGRMSALHYGTYDYSASLGVAAGFQSMDHPVADFAKAHMQAAAAQTGVQVSEGSTNILPLGSAPEMLQAWRLHARLVTRHLEGGIYQGWDLHAHQLLTRYAATFHFYQRGLSASADRLRTYAQGAEGAVLDEPATAKALAGYLQRGLTCGALTHQDVTEATGLSAAALAALARTGLLQDAAEQPADEEGTR
ncbi:DUF6986 family protein [Nesterenkonia populi]|uniref:DUF6986 family protein n=1 Tax=Nesterenkonia populi TaxID=1591087 RepID=UPI001FE728D1|nr:aldolase/citrate lyase family protein [Nesterenkonia populi]